MIEPSKVMPSKKKREGSVPFVLREDCFRVLDESNRVDPKKDPKLDQQLLLRLYYNMALTRAFDERGMLLQRQGRIGFFVPSFGQEAIQTGSVAAIEASDWIFPSYRDPGVFLYRGAPLVQMMSNLFGNSGDVCQGRQMPNHFSFADLRLFSVSSPIATQIIQAAGVAMASKIKKEPEVTLTYFGDGATSENDFHAGMTFAGVYRLPVVLICENNQHAISLPVEKQSGAKSLVDKAVGYGMPGIAVDGNDVLAVYQATKEAVDRARQGKGPTLIECLSYRIGPHSSSDDPRRYRDEALFLAWQKRDPIDRMGQYLKQKKLIDAVQEKEIAETCKQEMLEAVAEAEKFPPPTLESMFEDVYQQKTPQLERQLQALKAEKEMRGKFKNTSEAFPL